MSFLKVLFSFRGRLDRREFWLWSAGVFLVAAAGYILALLLLPSASLIGALGVTLLSVAIFQVWANAALQTKRLHDRGRSGLFVLAPAALCLVWMAIGGMRLAEAPPPSDFLWWCLNLVTAFTGFVMWLELGLAPGVPRRNRHGRRPSSVRAERREKSAYLKPRNVEPPIAAAPGNMSAAVMVVAPVLDVKPKTKSAETPKAPAWNAARAREALGSLFIKGESAPAISSVHAAPPPPIGAPVLFTERRGAFGLRGDATQSGGLLSK